MTREEIDMTIGIFTEAKKNGQFRAFWKTFDESVNLMASGEVVIQSMWSPAITAVKSRGIPCVYQPLEEGYRSWGGGIGLSKILSGLELDAAYEYINWYLDGWVGGFLMRQGYYSAVPETSKNFMSENEWGYWFEGKAAEGDITNPFGDKLARPAKRATAARSTTAWARSPAGTRSWTKTSTWSASGTSSSRPDALKPRRPGFSGAPASFALRKHNVGPDPNHRSAAA
jgi:spermidine/putrescine-binding protein